MRYANEYVQMSVDKLDTVNPILREALLKYVIDPSGYVYTYLRRGKRFDKFWEDMSNQSSIGTGVLYDAGDCHCLIREAETSAVIAHGKDARATILNFVSKFYITDIKAVREAIA